MALLALKRKKAYETNIEKINGARMTIETQMMAIENANVNLETMGAMRAGAEAMKNIHGSMYVLHAGWETWKMRGAGILALRFPIRIMP